MFGGNIFNFLFRGRRRHTCQPKVCGNVFNFIVRGFEATPVNEGPGPHLQIYLSGLRGHTCQLKVWGNIFNCIFQGFEAVHKLKVWDSMLNCIFHDFEATHVNEMFGATSSSLSFGNSKSYMSTEGFGQHIQFYLSGLRSHTCQLKNWGNRYQPYLRTSKPYMSTEGLGQYIHFISRGFETRDVNWRFGTTSSNYFSGI